MAARRSSRAIDARRRTAVLPGFALLGLCLLAAAAEPAPASCKTPLPDARLRALDDSAYVDPVRAVAAGRRSLAALASKSATQGLGLRLALVEADTSQNAAELAAAVRSLDAWEARLTPRSLGHACLLPVRSRVQGRLVHQDIAARDGMEAYRLATELQAPDARTEATCQLAVTYERAAMYDDGLRMIAQVIDTTRARSQRGPLANALFVKAQNLHEMARLSWPLP